MPYFFVGHFRIYFNGKKKCGFELIKPKRADAIARHPCSKITFFAVKLEEKKPIFLCHYYPNRGKILAEKVEVILEKGHAKIIGNGGAKKIKKAIIKTSTAEKAVEEIITLF